VLKSIGAAGREVWWSLRPSRFSFSIQIYYMLSFSYYKTKIVRLNGTAFDGVVLIMNHVLNGRGVLN